MMTEAGVRVMRGMQVASRGGKGKGTNSPLEPLDRL